MGALIFVIVIAIVGITFSIKKWRKAEAEMRKQNHFSSVPASPSSHTSMSRPAPSTATTQSSNNVTASSPVTAPVESSITATAVDLHTIASLRKFKSCVVIDTETTGLSPKVERIIEVSIATIESQTVIDRYSVMVNPERHISSSASAVNHIYDSDVENLPKFGDYAAEIVKRIDGRIVAGYNVKFDIDFLGCEFARAGLSASVQYVDVLPLAKRAFPGLNSYKLEAVATHAGLLSDGESQKHRADSDVDLTAKLLLSCINTIISNHDAEYAAAKEKRAQADRERREKYHDSPLLDKTFVFTGEFVSGRSNVENMVGTVGGILRDTVTKRLDYLVVGDITNLPVWAIARKLRKSEELISAGSEIKKVTEPEFLQMIAAALGEISNHE